MRHSKLIFSPPLFSVILKSFNQIIIVLLCHVFVVSHKNNRTFNGILITAIFFYPFSTSKQETDIPNKLGANYKQ